MATTGIYPSDFLHTRGASKCHIEHRSIECCAVERTLVIRPADYVERASWLACYRLGLPGGIDPRVMAGSSVLGFAGFKSAAGGITQLEIRPLGVGSNGGKLVHAGGISNHGGWVDQFCRCGCLQSAPDCCSAGACAS